MRLEPKKLFEEAGYRFVQLKQAIRARLAHPQPPNQPLPRANVMRVMPSRNVLQLLGLQTPPYELLCEEHQTALDSIMDNLRKCASAEVPAARPMSW